MTENTQQPATTQAPAASGGWDALTYILIGLALIMLCVGTWFIYSEYSKTMPAASGPGNDGTGANGNNTQTPNPLQASVSGGATGSGFVDAVKTVVNKVTAVVTGNPAGTSSDPFPLIKGSKGPEVKNVQHYMNTHSISNLVEDGIFGTKTETMLNNIWKTKSVTKPEYIKMMQEMNPGYQYGALPENAQYGSTQSSELA